MTESTTTYRLLIRPGRDGTPRTRRDVVAKLERVPTLERATIDTYRFGEPDEYGVMELELFPSAPGGGEDESLPMERIEVRVPRPWIHHRGPQVFALVFMAAEWIRWVVHDPQIGDDLQKEAVLQGLVAMRQAQLDRQTKPPGGSNAEEEGR